MNPATVARSDQRLWLVSLAMGIVSEIAFAQFARKLDVPMMQFAAELAHGSGKYANLAAPLQQGIAAGLDLLLYVVWGMYIVLSRQFRRANRMVAEGRQAKVWLRVT